MPNPESMPCTDRLALHSTIKSATGRQTKNLFLFLFANSDRFLFHVWRTFRRVRVPFRDLSEETGGLKNVNVDVETSTASLRSAGHNRTTCAKRLPRLRILRYREFGTSLCLVGETRQNSDR